MQKDGQFGKIDGTAPATNLGRSSQNIMSKIILHVEQSWRYFTHITLNEKGKNFT